MKLSISISKSVIDILQKKEWTAEDEKELENYFETDVPNFIYNRALNQIAEDKKKRQWTPTSET